MDAFRLLTRSTSLRQPAKQRDSTTARIPSAGVPTHPLTVSNLPSASASKDAVKRKRKRGASSIQVPAEPGPSVEEDVHHEEMNDEEWSGLEYSKSNGDAEMSGEECRRLLNQHKVKITVLRPPEKHNTGRVKKSKDSKKQSHTRIYPRPLNIFKDLSERHHVSKRLMANLDSEGYTLPTEVQAGSLPVLLGDKKESGLGEVGLRKGSKHAHVDLFTVAPTGSGKTLAFLIPIIQSLLGIVHEDAEDTQSYVRSIVLAPTHELMDQIVLEGKKLTFGTGIRISAMQKGSTIAQQHDQGATGDRDTSTIKSHILVSTPLMLVHSLESGTGPRVLPSVRFLVLDEADVLLDPLFRDQTLAIWKACTCPELRVSLWSATMGSSIEGLARDYILDRRRDLCLPSRDHFILRLVVGLKDSSLPSIDHRLVYAGTEQGKLLGLRELLHPSTAATHDQLPPLRPPFLIFTQTIERARALHSELLYDIPFEAGGSSRIAVLHSELSDRARSDVMSNFRRGEIWVIITTDLLSRGIDFRGVNGVVNYDIPTTAAVYVHRAGRTGRAGREGGIAVTLYTREDIPYVKNIANVVAATEKGRGNSGDGDKAGIQKWLLDSLPKVSRDVKEDLKRRGVAARRSTTTGPKSKEAKRARISTKSGYDRQREQRRKDAVEKHKRQQAPSDGQDNGWEGFDD